MTLVWCLLSWTLFAQLPPPAPPATEGRAKSAACAYPDDLSSVAPLFARFSIDAADDRGAYRLTRLPRGLFDAGTVPRIAASHSPSEGFARFDADAVGRKR